MKQPWPSVLVQVQWISKPVLLPISALSHTQRQRDKLTLLFVCDFPDIKTGSHSATAPITTARSGRQLKRTLYSITAFTHHCSHSPDLPAGIPGGSLHLAAVDFRLPSVTTALQAFPSFMTLTFCRGGGGCPSLNSSNSFLMIFVFLAGMPQKRFCSLSCGCVMF